jgi:hypothetical protein
MSSHYHHRPVIHCFILLQHSTNIMYSVLHVYVETKIEKSDF